jgi:hypothetical protein
MFSMFRFAGIFILMICGMIFPFEAHAQKKLTRVFSCSPQEYSYYKLSLHFDYTYVFMMRGPSCWTWWDMKGEYEQNGDTIILHHVIYEHSPFISILDTAVAQPEVLKIRVLTFDNTPIKGFEINNLQSDSAGYVYLCIDTYTFNKVLNYKWNNDSYKSIKVVSMSGNFSLPEVPANEITIKIVNEKQVPRKTVSIRLIRNSEKCYTMEEKFKGLTGGNPTLCRE